MGRRRVPENLSREVEYFMYDDVWNSLIVKDGKKYRDRVEILLFDEKGRLFIGRKSNGKYTIPGGSSEPYMPCARVQVVHECEEEALITPKNVRRAGYYERMYDDNNPMGEWFKTLPIIYDGMMVDVYTGQYDKPYTGEVEEKNRSQALANGEFVDVESIWDELIPEHKAVIMSYWMGLKK